MRQAISEIPKRKIPLVILTMIACIAYTLWLPHVEAIWSYLFTAHAIVLLWLVRPSLRYTESLARAVALLAGALVPYYAADSQVALSAYLFGALSGISYWLFLPNDRSRNHESV